MGVACWHGNASCTSGDSMDSVMDEEGRVGPGVSCGVRGSRRGS